MYVIYGVDDCMSGCVDASMCRWPGMFLVEIHTIGRVHYMLVEGIHEARAWASAIRDTYLHRARGDGRISPPQVISTI